MKITPKHLHFLGQKQYPNLAKELKIPLVNIHDLIPKDSRPYKRDLECEVRNTLQLLKIWKKNLGCSNAFYKKLEESMGYAYPKNTWRRRLFKKLIKARGKNA